MLDFQKLTVYNKSKDFYNQIEDEILSRNDVDKILKDQLKRASVSISLNIAEGSSRFAKADRCKFYIIARGSVFECMAIFELLEKKLKHELKNWNILLDLCEQLSKMLFAMIKHLKPDIVLEAKGNGESGLENSK